MTAIQKLQQGPASAPASRRKRRVCPIPQSFRGLVLPLLLLCSTTTTKIATIDALHISYALTSDSALRLVQNMASVVAAPPNRSRNRVFFDKTRKIDDDGDEDVKNGTVNGAARAAASNKVNGVKVNGASVNGRSQSHASRNSTSDINQNNPGVMNVVVPESGSASGTSEMMATTISASSVLSSLKETDQVELEVNGKKITPKPVTLQSMAWGVPEDADPKEQVWTALSKLESNSEFYISFRTESCLMASV